MKPLPDQARFQRSHDFVARAVAGETVLVPIRQQIGDLESIYTLNEVGSFIWSRLEQPATVAEVARALEETFAGDPATMRRDLEEFLEQLVTLQAVRPVGPSPGTLDPTPPR